MSDTAVDAAQALLVAMDTEEPFRLLRALPGKLEELRAIEWQSATFAEVRDAVFHVCVCPLSLRLGTSRGGNFTQPIESL